MKWILIFLTIGVVGFTLTTCEPPTKSDDDDDNGPDTTSHFFTWRLDTLGALGSRVFDVEVIDENNIWAVGEFYKTDYDNQDQWNAAHWDGQKWNMKQHLTISLHSDSPDPDRIDVVEALDTSFIFMIANGAYLFYRNGKWENERIDPWIAGWNLYIKDRNTIYSAGTDGKFAKFNTLSNTWTVIPTPTTLDFQDMMGVGDTILLVASNTQNNTPPAKLLLYDISENNMTEINTFPNSERLYSVWLSKQSKKAIFCSGDGKFYGNIDSLSWKMIDTMPGAAGLFIESQSDNDIFIGGGFNRMAHWNGATWKENFSGIPIPFSGNWVTGSYKNGVVCMAGYDGNISRIITGKRKE